jgi:hypothetical protein
VTIFEKASINQVFSEIHEKLHEEENRNQLTLFDL